MVLSTKLQKMIKIAIPDPKASAELIADLQSELSTVAADVPAVVTANATDLATSEALANQLKTTVNAILTNLKAAGLMS